MKETELLREQIRRMRLKLVEPEIIYMSPDLYKRLGKPRVFMGVPVDCESRLKFGFEVR